MLKRERDGETIFEIKKNKNKIFKTNLRQFHISTFKIHSTTVKLPFGLLFEQRKIFKLFCVVEANIKTLHTEINDMIFIMQENKRSENSFK